MPLKMNSGAETMVDLPVSILTRRKHREKFPVDSRDFFPNRPGRFVAAASCVARYDDGFRNRWGQEAGRNWGE
jgi:hypothetical protein